MLTVIGHSYHGAGQGTLPSRIFYIIPPRHGRHLWVVSHCDAAGVDL